MLGKIFGLLLFRKSVSDSGSLIESLLAGMAAIIFLAFISTLLFGLLLLGGLYIGRELLLAVGTEPLHAAMILEGSLLFLLVACVVAVIFCIRAIRTAPKRAFNATSPLMARINELKDAFIAGLNTPPPPSPEPRPPIH